MGRAKRKATDVPSSLAHIDIKALLRSRGVYLRQQHNKQLKEAFIPVVTQIVKGKGKPARKFIEAKDSSEYQPPPNARLSSEQIMDYYSKQIHSIEVVTEHFNLAVVKYLTFVNNKIIDKLEAEVNAQKSAPAKQRAFNGFETKDVFDDNEDAFLSQAQLDFTPLLDNLGIIAGQDALNLINVNEPYLLSPANKARIVSNVNKFTKSMLDTDRQHIINIITDGIEQGHPLNQIRDALTSDEALSFTKMQSTRITATEVLRTSTQSALDAWEQSGVVEGKQWITAGASDECSDYEGQIEVLSGNFYDDTDEFADGDPPLHPNCRCALIPIVIGTEEKDYFINHKNYKDRIKELESKLDKRTKDAKELINKRSDDLVYIKSLEKYLGITDETE